MSATGDNIGLMEGAFFVGRKIILDWINDFLQLNLGRIEETCTGAIACQLCDALYPGKVNMSKVRWDARADFEYVANYKVRTPSFRLSECAHAFPAAMPRGSGLRGAQLRFLPVLSMCMLRFANFRVHPMSR